MEQALEKFNPGALASIIGAENVAAINDDFSGGISGGNFLPQITIRGREFRLKIDGEETAIPDKFLNIYLISSRTSVSKVFYKDAWVSGGEGGKPACSSADGVTPDGNVDEPQNSNCQLCPNNAWGSKITQAGKKGKACQDYKLIVVALQAAPDTPFSLRIPAASLKLFSAYITKLKMAGAPANAAVTRLSFTDAEFPQLDFDFVDTVKTAAEYEVLKELALSSEVMDAVHITPRAQIAAPAAPEVHESVQPVVAQITEVAAPVVEPVVEAEPDLAAILRASKEKKAAERAAKKADEVVAAPAVEEVAAPAVIPADAAVAPAEPAITGLDGLLAKMKKNK